jgi:hypothetical protein
MTSVYREEDPVDTRAPLVPKNVRSKKPLRMGLNSKSEMLLPIKGHMRDDNGGPDSRDQRGNFYYNVVHGGADHGSGGLTRSARGTSLSQIKGVKKTGVDGILLKGQANYLGGPDSGPGAGGAGGAFGTTGYGAGGVNDANTKGGHGRAGGNGQGKRGVFDPNYISKGGKGAYGVSGPNSGHGGVIVGNNGEVLYGAEGDYTGS